MSGAVDLELRRGRAHSDGEEIYWELTSTGDGDDRPVVVLSHGAGGSHAVWFQQVPVLGSRYRVLTWDARGFGNSTNVGDATSAEAGGADLAAVLDELGIERAHLVGQSMGGWHIAAFADATPERVASLVFADTIGGLWTDGLRAAFAEFSSRGGLAGPPRIGAHRALWSGTAERDPALAFLYEQLGTFFDPPMSQLGRTLRWSIEHEHIADMGVPVLVIAGEHDPIFPSPLLAESAALIAGARFVEIVDAGHSPYFEQPAAWNGAVLDFLSDAR